VKKNYKYYQGQKINGYTFIKEISIYKRPNGSKTRRALFKDKHGIKLKRRIEYIKHTKSAEIRFAEINNYASNKIYYSYKRGAKVRCLLFDLNITYFNNMILNACHYCNSKPKKPVKKGNIILFLRNGIDRKDPNIGYTKTNCVPCCFICNYGKLDLPYDDFVKYIKNIKSNK